MDANISSPGAAVLSACVLCAAPGACASHWYAEPVVSLQTFYDDNIGLARTDPEQSAGLVARAAVTTGTRTETHEIGVQSSLESRQYEADSERSSTDFAIAVNGRRLFERDELAINARYDYDSTLTSELATSGFVNQRKRRRAWSLSPSWTHSLNERTVLNAVGGFYTAAYEDAELTALVDYDYTTAALSISYGWDPSTQLLGRVDYSDYQPDGNLSGSQTVGFQLGASRKFSETWSASVQLGIRQTDSDFDSESGHLADIFVSRQLESGSMTLAISRALLPSGSGELLETRTIGFDLRKPLSPRLTLRFDLEDRVNAASTRSESSSGDRHYFTATPRFIYNLDRDWSVTGGYRYRYQKYEAFDDSADANIVFMTLAYRPRPETRLSK